MQSALNTLMTPEAKLEAGVLSWGKVDGAAWYEVFVAGNKYAQTDQERIPLENVTGDIQVVALSADGVPSFPSEPIAVYEEVVKHWKQVRFNKCSADYNVEIEVPENGRWALIWNYSNGNGSIETDRKCAIRTLYLDGIRQDVCVFPQRGEDAWDDWGYTMPTPLNLTAGKHRLTLRYQPENANMHLDINEFALRGLKLQKLD